jgi:DNA-binding response OmpR family regulator
MATSPTLLCIHRDPARVRVLQENGYELLTAANGHEGLCLFRSRPVDAIVIEYNLGLLDGSLLASKIKQVRPKIPIVMLAEHADLPDGALHAVDVLVSTSDPPHFLWAAVHFLLNVRPARGPDRTPGHLHHPESSGQEVGHRLRNSVHWSTHELATGEKAAPFSPREWKSIRNGTVQF